MTFKLFIAAALVCSIPALGMTEDPRFQPKNDISRPAALPVYTNLGISCVNGTFDLTSDNNNTVHIVWWDDDEYLHYGQIVNNQVVNEEVIPESDDVQTQFCRPRILARPDGASVHLTWMTPRPGTSLIHCWRDSAGWHRETVWDGEYVAVPDGVADLTGRVHIIAQFWTNNSNQGGFYTKIKYWSKAPGEDYNAGWTLHEGTLKWRDTSMFIDRNGGIHIAFKSGRDPGKYIYCPSGGTLVDQEILDIPVAKDAQCVSFGDLFVDKNFNVHHVFMSYDLGAIDYSFKPAGTKNWTEPYRLSDGPVPLCEETAYEHVWPGCAVDTDGRVYGTWVDMPCPDIEANRIHLQVKENEVWTHNIVTEDASIVFTSKPAITANDEGVFLLYRDNKEKLILYSITAKELYISNPSGGQKICAANYSGGILPIKVTVTNPAGITRVEFFADGGKLGEVTAAPYEYNWNISQLNPGSHLIKVIAHKTTSETIESEVTIDIDCPPTLKFVNFFDGSTIAETTNITVDVHDDKNEIQKVDFYVDDSLKFSDITAPYEFLWDPQSLFLGEHTLTVIASDRSGLTTSNSIRVRYWPLFPPVSVSGTKKTNRTLFIIEYYNYLTWQANPKNTNVQVTNYKIYEMVNGVKNTLPMATVNANTLNYSHRNVAKDQSYIYFITTVDQFGYESAGQVVLVGAIQ